MNISEPRSSESLRLLERFVFRFPLPATKPVEFKKCFQKNLGNEETEKVIHHMDKVRNDLTAELLSPRPNYRNVIASAVEYIPMIAQTIAAFEKAAKPIYLAHPLAFEWTTGIGNIPRTRWLTNQAVIWEKCMVLASQGLAQANAVHSMVGVVEGDDDTLYPTASTQLRCAAGIFNHLYSIELPTWIGPTSLLEKPPESMTATCEALSIFCLAQAQQMAVAKALNDGKTPRTLLARLCLGVANQMDVCETTLRDKETIHYSKLSPQFLSHIEFQSTFHRALAHLFIGINEWEKGAYGLGIAQLKEANNLVRNLPNPYENKLLPALRTFKLEIQSLFSSYDTDNNSIYYDSVPHEVPDLPDGILMMKPIPFSIPKIDELAFNNPDDE